MQKRLPHSGILAAVAQTIAGCSAPPAIPERVADAAAAPLVNTHWRLTQLGERVIDNPPGAAAVGLQLQPQNPRVTGFAGCNRIFGGYLLNGEQLKFDEIGATKMACLDQSRMQLEQEYFQMLSLVASWKISGSSLQLQDAGGAMLATFSAGAPEQ